jgi:hypothetical protein
MCFVVIVDLILLIKMKKAFLYLCLVSTLVSCQKSETKKLITNLDSPYAVFFDELEIEKITDTILVPFQTRIFGCGTAYIEFQEHLKKKGLDKFYEKYKDVLSDSLLIKKFEIKNKTKILWIFKGNEGELFQLADTVLHKKTNFEKRILASKTHVSISEYPISMDSVDIYVSMNYPITNKNIEKTYSISKKGNEWKINKLVN